MTQSVALLTHLAEVEARGIHRVRACASLYTYCIYELRFSEDAAARRSSAAKLVKRFPVLIDSIANGELHLTGLLMIGPHLTPENHVEVIARAKFRTKKELGKLARELHPLPSVRDCIEPLGPEPAPLRKPTWQAFTSSLAPSVRELRPGQRPADWLADAPELEPPPLESSPTELPPLTGPQQYQVRFMANEEYVQLVERAKALLGQRVSAQSLGDLHVEAMRSLVASLEKQKFALTDRPGSAAVSDEAPRQRGRHIPAAVRRAVFIRDEGRCTYTDERGRTLSRSLGAGTPPSRSVRQRRAHTTQNLTLRCHAHNDLAAEHDFGRARMAKRKDGSRHVSLRCELRSDPPV